MIRKNLFIVVFPFNIATNDPRVGFEREMSALHVEMSQPITGKHQGEHERDRDLREGNIKWALI